MYASMSSHACIDRRMQQREHELVIMQERDYNNSGTNTRRRSAFGLSLSSVCRNQAEPRLADRAGCLLADCYLSTLNVTYFMS